MRLVVSSLFFTLALGCPKSVPEVVHQPAADAGVDPLLVRLNAIEAEAATVVRGQDEALWQHWTTGAALDVSGAAAGHDALFSRSTLLELRTARTRLGPRDARRAAHLERWLSGELLARALSTENDAVASLEAGLTFSLDGKDVAWRDLPRLLLTEKSAIKRRALWKASLPAAERLDAALARRDAKAAEAAAALDSPSTLELAAEARELELDELARAAEAVLSSTEDAWRTTLQHQSDAEVRLPLANLTRAELPRLLRVGPAVDAAFPKEKVPARAIELLGGLGVYGRPGLTLELSERATKHPLPLAVAPAPSDVRVSFRPVGGLRDQAALFSEVGAALALREAATGHLATERLGDPASAQVLAELFAGLVGSPPWLKSVGITGATQQAVVDAWTAQRLFLVRRAAGVVLVRLETQGLAEPEARARFVQIMSRALALPASAEDGVRWRIDTDDFLRSATTLKAAAMARLLRARLPPDWFASKDAWATLARLWKGGTEAPLEARLATLGVATEALSVALSGGGAPDGGLRPGPWPAPAHLATDVGAAPSRDGGLKPGPWRAPAQVATDAGLAPSGDGGLKPGPWPAAAQVAVDAGAGRSDGGGGLQPGGWPGPARAAVDGG